MSIFSEILNTKDGNFDTPELDFNMLAKWKTKIANNDFFDYILESENGGFFLEQSLHIYGFSDLMAFHSIEINNFLIKSIYAEISEKLLVFGQDIFGNQFAFDQSEDNSIIFFNIETGEREFISPTFKQWIKDILTPDYNHYTGVNIAKKWRQEHSLFWNERLVPKIPFVIGGEYDIVNLYASEYPKYVETNANIAKQIFNLPDGTNIKLTIK